MLKILPIKYAIICITCIAAATSCPSAFANHKVERPAPGYITGQSQLHTYRQMDIHDYLILASGDEKSIKQRKAYYQSLPKDEREKIRRAREEYERLPPEEKQKIRKRWEQTPEQEKNKYKKWKKDKYRD